MDFRKEYVAAIEASVRIAWRFDRKVFLESLHQSGIREAVTGVAYTPRA